MLLTYTKANAEDYDTSIRVDVTVFETAVTRSIAKQIFGPG